MIYSNYQQQQSKWPSRGRHILAQFDNQSIWVYQAYRPAIAEYAVEHQKFGGEFSFSRMSWIKPNFLWMMYRCGWATKQGQERVLAIRIPRTFFEQILCATVASTFDGERYSTKQEWQRALAESDVRLQWDPDHDPKGRPLERRAIQLGLRRTMLKRFGQQEALQILDLTDFVAAQRVHVDSDLDRLIVPTESVYVPESALVARN